MIIIFQCYGGTHTSAAAASIYLGALPRSRVPRLEEVLAMPYFDRVDSAGVGALNYAGRDRRGNRVFILGSSRWGGPMRELLVPLSGLYGPVTERPGVAVIDCYPLLSWPVRMGGFISRRLGLTALGRPLVGRGILRIYPRLLELVERFERDPAPHLL